MKARVFVTLKPSVFDPQGHTIAEALHSLGYDGVSDVRQGKYFELDLGVESAAEAEQLATDVANKVLAKYPTENGIFPRFVTTRTELGFVVSLIYYFI